jgi:serine/threonine protein kinase
MSMITTVAFDKLAGVSLGNYHLERYIGQSKIGPTFLARNNSSTTYLLRFLDRPMDATQGEREAYLERFQYRARQVANLQHPYILPLLDFGVYRGLPYLISPHIPLRSLRTRIAKHGVLDTFTVGRYLDQIATALEYAHEHAILHGSLSVDSVFIRLDGNLAVADIGVKNLLDASVSRNQAADWSEGLAPEVMLGRPASPASDVYALGTVVYFLLTGTGVFENGRPEDMAQRQINGAIPLLKRTRSDLPPSMDSVLAGALARDPAQRYNQPGAFANAYHLSGVPTNRMRVPFVVSDTPAIRNHQAAYSGPSAMDTPFYERSWNSNSSNGTITEDQIAKTPRPPDSHSLHGFPEDEPLSLLDTPRPAMMRRFGSKQRQRNLLIASLAALLVIASAITGVIVLSQKSAATGITSGAVTFFDSQNNSGELTDSLRITVQNLATPPSGSVYDAWIIDDASEQVLALGTLAHNNQSWTLTYNSASTNLLTVGNKLEVSQEQGKVTVPTGPIVLVGTFPVKSYAHILHLLVSFPETPGKVGFLIGLVSQTHLLDNQAIVLQSMLASKNTNAIECVTQSMLNIIGGTHDAHYKPLASTCVLQNVTATGDGFGISGKSGYIASVGDHASYALSQPDATSAMRQHAALMNVALTNISGWMAMIQQDLLQLQAQPTDQSTIQQIVTLADNSYHGVDVNGDGQIDPVPGEAGAITAYQQGQLMATVTLTSPSV